jgi:prepilin-type processing-associated H-X9-DG protein
MSYVPGSIKAAAAKNAGWSPPDGSIQHYCGASSHNDGAGNTLHAPVPGADLSHCYYYPRAVSYALFPYAVEFTKFTAVVTSAAENTVPFSPGESMDRVYRMTVGEYNQNLTCASGNRVFKFKEGIERFLITDINNPAGAAQAQSSIMVGADYIYGRYGYESPSAGSARDQRLNHVPGGVNMLFGDGHVEFIKYPQPPNTKYWYASKECNYYF